MTKILAVAVGAIGLGLAVGNDSSTARGFGLSLLASLGAGYALRAFDRSETVDVKEEEVE